MIVVNTIAEVRRQISDARSQGRKIAFVPTMGNLHSGHLALVDEARRQGDFVVASIFVNPLQFGKDEDLESYPRTLEADREKLEQRGCDLLFAPSAKEMYPEGNKLQTLVDVPALGSLHCGASRPGHFQGVATVVTKLFVIVQPDVAVFGRKDFQQLAVIKTLTRDLSLPVEIVGAETVRADNGLALSSRNGYLSESEKESAATLYHVLLDLRRAIEIGRSDYRQLEAEAAERLREKCFRPDYIHICRQSDLLPPQEEDTSLVILAAARLGPARLIDNLAFDLS